MRAYRIRVGNSYVQYVDVETGQVLLTGDRDEAGLYSEAGVETVKEMLDEADAGQETVH